MKQRRKACSALLGCLLAIFISGCGVFDVPEQANAAAEEWAAQTGETDPCKIDAMQHCIGGALAAAHCGEGPALLLGMLLEIYQNDGDEMDLHNNAAGAHCGVPLDGGVEAAVACCESLLNANPPELSTDGGCQ